MDNVQSSYPEESSGSMAQARFFYQHQYSAYWCILMLENKDIECVICEHHEDLLVKFRNGRYKFIQIKTRAEGEGEWTLARLLQKDGENSKSILEKLFDKKRNFGLGQSHDYLFVSDMGASDGGQPTGLNTLKKLTSKDRDSWSAEEINKFALVVTKISEGIKHSQREDLEDFCHSLKVETGQTGRSSIRSHNIDKLHNVLTSSAVNLQYPDLENIYDEILKLIRDANIVEDEYLSHELIIKKKTIQRQQVEEIIRATPGSKIYLERIEQQGQNDSISAAEITKLEEKTKNAGFDHDSILYLKDMRASANVFRRKHHVGSARTRLEQLSMQVQRICVKVKNEAIKENLDGIDQWLLLEKYLTDLANSDKSQSNFPLVEVDYLFGEVGNLTGKCKIRWWTK